MPGKWDDMLESAGGLLAGGDSRRLAESTLELLMVISRSRCGAVFACEGDRLGLVVSRGLDQGALDATHRVWVNQRRSLASGRPFYSGGPESFLTVPLVDGEEVAGVVYLDTPDPSFRVPGDHLASLCRILCSALSGLAEVSLRTPSEWESYLERTSPEEIERERLLLLLNRNEWNIARVSRILGVTRMTIYNRLGRFNIPRERVLKTPRRVRA
jgi:Bacterial regulatory protein, Fis family